MGNEATLTTYNDLYPASVIADSILDEERPYNAMTNEMFRYHGPDNSTVADFPIQADPGVAAASTEGTGIANATSGFSSDKASATLGTVGQMTTVTDELADGTQFDMISHVARVLGRSCAEKRQTDYTDLLDAFANTTIGGTAAGLTEANNQLAQRDQVGQAVGVLDPSAIGAVQQDFIGSGAAAFGNSDIRIGDLVVTNLDAFAFQWGRVPYFQTSLVPATGGAVFIVGVALGLYDKWSLRVRSERDESMPGTEVVAFERYGVVEVRDRAGETVT